MAFILGLAALLFTHKTRVATFLQPLYTENLDFICHWMELNPALYIIDQSPMVKVSHTEIRHICAYSSENC